MPEATTWFAVVIIGLSFGVALKGAHAAMTGDWIGLGVAVGLIVLALFVLIMYL
jgi:hypothetical protein